MKLKKKDAEFFIPDNKPISEALARTTHMAVAAHQDDIEIFSYHGILNCFGKDTEWFFGTVVTSGAGSPRNNIYTDYTDEDMKKIRKIEQKKAAFIGEYGALALLNYESSEVKDKENDELIEELLKLISIAKPKIIYTHNLADKHPTHVAVVIRLIEALRKLPFELRPEKLYGCEVWRNLDWLMDNDKEVLDVSDRPNLASALVSVFDSQICGGKRYDSATIGRRLANATFSSSHEVDKAQSVTYAMDLTPLITDLTLSISQFVTNHIRKFEEDVSSNILKFL
jgi:LmbE family N-acetylglucosaminyl deacetylase